MAVLAAAAMVGAACEFAGTDDVTRTDPNGGGGPGGQPVDLDAALQGLCARAGGPAAVAAIAQDTVNRMTADCRVGGYFSSMDAKAKAHLSDCFTTFLSEVFTCPGVTYAGSKDTAGAACRDMKTSHQNLRLTSDDQRAFQETLTSALRDTGKLIPTDVGNVVTRFAGQRDVYNLNAKGNNQCTCPERAGCAAVPVDPPRDSGRDTGGGGGQDAGPDTSVADTGPG